jgi:hypothetical protein
MFVKAKTKVARRRVFYIPGYDPHPPRRYRELYRTESQKQAAISGYRIEQKADRSDTGWRVRSDMEGHQVQTKIDVLVWHDLVQGSMRGGIAGTYLALMRTAWIYLSTGTLRRLSWLAKGPVLAALYPVAMEGALKLKEISYIHAEAYPAGELKHGPLALVDKDMPVVAVAPRNDMLDKLKANLQEVRARGGELFVFAEQGTLQSEEGIHVIELPAVDDWLEPLVYTVPLQLLSYHVAVLKGTDVDQPRNLAKSVTVE